MSNTQSTVLFEQALALEPESRRSLAVRILASIPIQGDPDVEGFWRQEVSKRLDDLQTGSVTPVSWDETMARMEQIINE